MRLALIDDDGTQWTHDDLERRAAARADELANRHGVRAGDRVAVLAHGSSEVFVLLAACNRLGAALAPVSWRLAAPEVEAVLEDCRPRVALGFEHVQIDPGHEPRPGIAQILYTSGTTGRPRGACLTRRQIDFNARTTISLLGLSSEDRTLAMLPLFHTGGLNALATPVLAAGGAVSIMRRFVAADAVARIGRDRITAIIGVPTIYELLLDAGLRRTIAPALRHLLVGGAPVPPSLFTRYRAAGFELRQGFGMTEVGPNCFDLAGDGTVGRPVPGTEARLVDGELELRGPHVFAGYLGHPPHHGWFATGDLFAVEPDGRYRVIGRRKEMFISGGENIHPAEIELALAGHPAVVEAAVVGVADPRWGEVGLAAVVARTPVAPAELERWLRNRIAAYKVPKRWRFVDALPRTASGKISRAALAREAAPGG